MIFRIASSAERVAFVVIATLAAFVLSYFSIRNARAVAFTHLESSQGYERATQLEPSNPRNWLLLGRYWQYNLEDTDIPRAIRAYRTALSIDSHSTESWLDLGAAYEMQGDVAQARQAFLEAKKSYPLSSDVAWRYGNFLLRQGELDLAFAEIRRAVESDPKRGPEAFSRCIRVEPDIQKILDRVLPPSPEVYLNVIADLAVDRQTANALIIWERLIALHPHIALPSVFQLVDELRQAHLFTDAARVWSQAVSLAGITWLQDPPQSAIWDGGFESAVTGRGYAWTFPGVSHGVQILIDSHEKHSGKYSLRLTFDGKSNLDFKNVCHFVPVQSSTPYRFSAWVRTRGLTTDQGIKFELQSGSTVQVTPEIHGTQPWTVVEQPWTSGPNAEELQVCVQRSPSAQPDNRIQGAAWVDDVALVPQPAGSQLP